MTANRIRPEENPHHNDPKGAVAKLAPCHPQDFEGLLVNAADMAVAKSMQPATARNPIGLK